MNTQRAYNKKMENSRLLGSTAQKRKRYRQIVKEMGAREITLKDIAEPDLNGKFKGFLDMLSTTNTTMDEAVVLQQYAKAIVQADTKAAEFIRDTAGDKPSTQIDLSTEDNGLSQMSYEELISLRDALLSTTAPHHEE